MKNLPTIVFYLLILLAISGCRAKKNLSIERVKSDSVVVRTETIERPPLLSSLTINEICDSVTNKPVQFEKVFVIKNDTIRISTIDNQLRFKFQAQSELVRVYRDSIAVLKSSEKIDKSEVRYRLDWRLLLGALALGVAVGWIRPWRFI